MKVDISGFEEMRKQLENTRGNFDDFLRGFLIKEALRVLAKTKKLTPTISGYLRNSWQISNTFMSGGNLTVYIYNPAEYASYVEYGHVTRSSKGKSGKGSARSGWVQGQFMCTISIKEVENRMPAHFNAEFKKWIKSMGVGK
ncbi:MAG: HK97 gp10 family phage protein [Clostridiales bacterium]